MSFYLIIENPIGSWTILKHWIYLLKLHILKTLSSIEMKQINKKKSKSWRINFQISPHEGQKQQ